MDTNDIIVTSSSDGTNEAVSEKLASAQDAVENEVTETSDTEETDSEETSSEADEQDEADSETHAEYIEAVTEWKLDQRERAREEKAKADKQKEQIDSSVSSFQAKAKEFSEKTKDFSEVLADVDDIPMPPHLQQLFLEAESGPELMYELAKNREEYERVSRLSPWKAGIELGKIEARIEARKQAKAAPKPITKSKAPPPITPVGGDSSASAKSIYDSDIPQNEYEELRRKQMKRSW